MRFRWNAWNLDHAGRHGVGPEDAEVVVANAEAPYPRWRPDDKWLVWGRDRGGGYVQVVFFLDPDGTIYVIHARPFTEREKSRQRRERRK